MSPGAFGLCLCVLLLGGCGADGVGTAGSPAPELPADPPARLNILVIGGTSGVGLETVKLALSRGHSVTAMSRHPERLVLEDGRLLRLAGDILDPAAVRSAVEGRDAVVIAIGMGLTRNPVTLFSQGTEHVLTAMRAQGVRRLVAVTGIGAGNTRGHGGFFYDSILTPLGLKTIYQDKDRQEALIAAAGDNGAIDWTVVRPGFLTDGPALQRYRVVTNVTGLTAGDISRADVGHFIVAAIESGSHVGLSPLLSE